jgi:hypothetical protein
MAVRTVRPMVRLRAAARRRRTARTFWICWQPRHMRPRRKMKPPMTREEYPAHRSTLGGQPVHAHTHTRHAHTPQHQRQQQQRQQRQQRQRQQRQQQYQP